ncbi:hypothetical protein BC833DRAFT_609860 [Globomyces pollinis-pini]|nr:hypothetical protein BC833DRAFT_609860 [Globomyces pollinis-pini]
MVHFGFLKGSALILKNHSINVVILIVFFFISMESNIHFYILIIALPLLAFITAIAVACQVNYDWNREKQNDLVVSDTDTICEDQVIDMDNLLQQLGI